MTANKCIKYLNNVNVNVKYANKNYASKVYQNLNKIYPNAKCELNFNNPFELLVATVLSAQCTDKRVNQVTPVLFSKYEGAEALAKAPIKKIETIIRSTGFFKNKALSLKNIAKELTEKYNNQVPTSMEELIKLKGIGRKSSNVILGSAYNITSGIVVDTHVKRLSKRLNLSQNNTPEKIEIDLMKIIPQKKWIKFSHLLVFHGRRICKAIKPICSSCIINQKISCYYYSLNKKT